MPAKPKKQQNTTVSKKGRKASSRSTTVKAKSAAPKRTTKTVDAPPDWATATRYTYRSHVD